MNQLRQLIKHSLTAVIPRRLFLVQGAPRLQVPTPSLAAHSDPRTQIPIALTFDDGPHPEFTPRLLDVLKHYQQQATFFVIGSQALQYPEIIQRMIREGHEVGNHTLTHSEPALTSAKQFLEEISQTDQILHEITGCIPRLVRPPKGKLSLGKMLGLWRRRKTIVLWDTDPRDYQMTDTAQINQWCEGYQPAAGNFCLMHDNHPYAIEAVRQLSENQQYNIQSLGVSHWLGCSANQTQINHRAYA
ncbi:Peptidoglycan-N-acetylmuramic acid deacetylase PdaC [Gimesia panareensis]|uniref:Peptidoglycan-N-acetylmuramic acid deacetylase PdaC n=1 Tax=Gimesia panareensis TaxID=2527978 RepID=A0A517Q8F3_9PLAN|nr:polysaccharide deacetylase family protein [Gimesia panareensis]QDT27922.1 Peptidoglycan-N-acetylmuramic acid deacetylase PdaC [Gimesia panareensis]